MPTVEVINVEVGANLPRLDQNMRASEQRVDRAANRMSASVARVDRRMASVGRVGAGAATGFGVGGLMGGRSMGGLLARLGPAALGFGAGALGAGGIQDVSKGLAMGVSGVSRALESMDSSVLFSSHGLSEFGKALNRETKGFQGLFDNFFSIADEWNAMVEGLPSPAQQKNELRRLQGLGRAEEEVGFDLRAARAVTEEQKKQIEYERKLAEIMREQNEMLGSATTFGEKSRIIDLANRERELALIERDRKGKTTVPAFNEVGTVFGQFKIPSGQPRQQKAADDTAKATKETADNTDELVTLFTNLMNRLTVHG